MKPKEASKHSIYNVSELKKSQLAGCYHCKKTFLALEITETTDGGKTALCPKCGIDSVLPDTSPYKLNVETLAQLKKYWF